MERYSIIKKLGEGSFGCVWKARNVDDGELVAIKTMKRKYKSWEECVNLQEVKSLRKMNNVHIVKLKEVIKEYDVLYFVFEYMDGNMHQLLKGIGRRFSEEEIRNWCLQMLLGLAHMHQQGYFHRDLKPENLLVKGNVIKIGDLGSAREINSPPPYTEYITTRWYRAPEVLLQSGEYNSAVDMWAMGAIMAELFTLKPIFPGSSSFDQMYKICSVIGTPTETNWLEGLKRCAGVPFSVLIPSASDDAIDLITRLCSWDPCKRPTTLEALRHPFFKSCCQVPPSLSYRHSINRTAPSVVNVAAVEKQSLPMHYGTLPNLKPSGILYPVNHWTSTTGVPYMAVVNNQGITTNRNFSKAVARPKPIYFPPSSYITHVDKSDARDIELKEERWRDIPA